MQKLWHTYYVLVVVTGREIMGFSYRWGFRFPLFCLSVVWLLTSLSSNFFICRTPPVWWDYCKVRDRAWGSPSQTLNRWHLWCHEGLPDLPRWGAACPNRLPSNLVGRVCQHLDPQDLRNQPVRAFSLFCLSIALTVTQLDLVLGFEQQAGQVRGQVALDRVRKWTSWLPQAFFLFHENFVCVKAIHVHTKSQHATRLLRKPAVPPLPPRSWFPFPGKLSLLMLLFPRCL